MFKFTFLFAFYLTCTFVDASFIHVGRPDDCPFHLDIDLQVINYEDLSTSYWPKLNFSIYFDNWGTEDISNYKFVLYDVMPRDRLLPLDMVLVDENGSSQAITIYDKVTVSVLAGKMKVWGLSGELKFRIQG